MSVVVQGMKMPKAYCDCCMYKADIYYCAAAGRDINMSSSNEGRCSFCPLVHIPTPHGELIEREKLQEREFIHEGDAYAVVMSRNIRNAPTILPADESDMDSFIRIFKEDDDEDGMDSFIRIFKD